MGSPRTYDEIIKREIIKTDALPMATAAYFKDRHLDPNEGDNKELAIRLREEEGRGEKLVRMLKGKYPDTVLKLYVGSDEQNPESVYPQVLLSIGWLPIEFAKQITRESGVTLSPAPNCPELADLFAIGLSNPDKVEAIKKIIVEHIPEKAAVKSEGNKSWVQSVQEEQWASAVSGGTTDFNFGI